MTHSVLIQFPAGAGHSGKKVVVRTEKRLSTGEWNDAGETVVLKPGPLEIPSKPAKGKPGEEGYLPATPAMPAQPGPVIERTVYDGERFVVEEVEPGEEKRGAPRVDVDKLINENAALKAAAAKSKE